MPRVETTVWINASISKVLSVARNNREFPEFMDDVDSLTIVEETENRVVSNWVGRVPTFGLKIRWTQEDLWDLEQNSCQFRQLKGDYDQLDGVWNFIEENNGTRFNSVLDYEYNVPGVGFLIGKVVHGLVTKNMDGVLGAIKDRSQKILV